jgi:hypothetical protein
MEVFVPERSHVMALALLGTSCLVGVSALILVAALWVGKRVVAARALAAALLMSGGYLLVLLAYSFSSEERVLVAGDWKYFCELDCHTAYTVTDVRRTRMLGSGDKTITASGTFYVVTLKTWFDPDTTRVDRGNGLLYPNLRQVRVEDDSGRQFGPSLEGMKVLEASAAQLVPLTQALRPGDSYQTTFVFDLPADARNPWLLLTDPSPVNLVFIGHENSFFHKKIYFRL